MVNVKSHPALAIGPANYAGQATAWARAMQQWRDLPAWSFSRWERFAFEVDRRLPPLNPGERRVRINRDEIQAAVEAASHVALDGFMPLSGDMRRGSIRRDARELQADGRSVLLIAHGSDIRDPLRHMRRLPNSWFRQTSRARLLRTAQVAGRNRRIARRLGVPLLVSTPDLLWDAPDAQWLPLTLTDLHDWMGGAAPLERVLPKVFHLPTSSVVKGSDVIVPVLEGLERAGRIEFVRPAPCSHEEFKAHVRDADIVVDQVRSDLYGMTAVEGMAAGRLVIASVGPSRDNLPAELPVVDATPDTFCAVMGRVLTAREVHQELAARGPAYVRDVHDGRRSALAISRAMGLEG